jgi:branched-chain amino acid transport system substrate-binding protein
VPARPTCPACGAALSAGARYCDRCGTPLQTAPTNLTRRHGRPPGRVSVAVFVVLLTLLLGLSTVGGYWYRSGELPLVALVFAQAHTRTPADFTISEPMKENAEEIAHYLRSVVTINARGTKGDRWGSGFIVDGDGHVVTAAHVVDGSACVSIMDDNGRSYQGSLLNRDDQLDVALLYVPGLKGWPARLDFGQAADAQPGAGVYVLGSPKGVGSAVKLSATVNSLGQSTTVQNQTFRNLIQFSDATVMEGTSGGPLIARSTGKVVGMVVVSGAPAAVAWARPAADILPLVSDWARITPSLGCQFEKPSRTIDLTLATITPRSGSYSVEGEDIADGAELALREMDEALRSVGYAVTLTRMDDKGAATIAREKAAEAAADPKVVGVVGSLENHTTYAIAEALKASGTPVVAPTAGADELTARGWGHFTRIVANSGRQEQALTIVAKQQLKVSSVLVVEDGTPEAARQVATFSRSAQTIALRVAATVQAGGATDVTAEVKKRLAESGAEAVYLAMRGDMAVSLVQSLRKEGILVPVLGNQVLADNRFRSLTGPGGEGIYFTQLTTEPSELFRRTFEGVFGRPTRGYAAYGYDAARVLLEALVQYGEANPAEAPSHYDLAPLVREIKGYLGHTAPITFDRNGENLTSWVHIYQWKQGVPELLLKLQ